MKDEGKVKSKALALANKIIAGRASWLRDNWKIVLSVVLFWLILLFATFLRFHMISGTMPYSGSHGEVPIVSTARDILAKGDFNPHFFNYPSLSIYLAAAGFTIGYINAASHLELKETKAIEIAPFPYYKHPRIVWPAKAIFAILSVIALFFMGKIAYRAYGNPLLLFLVPLVMSLCSTYFIYSHKYLNADIVGAFFVMAVYYYLFTYIQTDNFLHKSIVPGVLSGLAVASKYNLSLIAIPCILTILLYSKRQRAHKILLLLAIMFVAFVMVVPYSILDFKTFLDDVGFEAHHYQKGHRGSDGVTGFPQFIYYLRGDAPGGGFLGQGILKDFGYWTCLFAIIGVITALLKNWKKTVVLLSFPAALLWYMSMQKVHFIRNIVSVYAFYALFAGVGAIGLYRLLSLAASKLPFLRISVKSRSYVITCLLIAAFMLVFPVDRTVKWAQAKADSRKLALKWIAENVEKRSIIIVPEELSIDIRPLRKDYFVRTWKFEDLGKGEFDQRVKHLDNPYILLPFFGVDKRRGFSGEDLEKLNNLVGDVDTLKTFHTDQSVLINFSFPVPWGNPTFSIGRLKNRPYLDEEQVERGYFDRRKAEQQREERQRKRSKSQRTDKKRSQDYIDGRRK